VESLERYSQNERVIEEFTTQQLAGIATRMGRLVRVAKLRDVSIGRYQHAKLEAEFSAPAVHQALLYCHEELFEQVLESALEQQEWDVRMYLASLEVPAKEIANRWMELEYFRMLVPFGTPSYLRDLFISNMRVILGLIAADDAKLRTAA
jgi:hypothetical protein